MTKQEMIDQLAVEFSISKAQANRIIDFVFGRMKGALAKEGDVFAIQGFGTFKVIRRASRTGRNPRTGQPLEIPETLAIRFHQSVKNRLGE